jgi:hypothetical protein
MLFADSVDYNGMAVLATALFTGLGVMITTIFSCYLQLKKMGEGQAAQAKQAVTAANAVAEVKSDVKAVKSDLAANSRTTRETHRLVNGGMTSQLRTNASLARQLADMTNDSTDRKLAEEAEHRLETHIAAGTAEGAKGD